MPQPQLPPGQQLAAASKWPTVGEPTPKEMPSPWTVRIQGCVQREMHWTLEELQALPQRTQAVDIHCVTRWSKPGMQFAGVPLNEVLKLATPTDAARFVSFVAVGQRRHSTSLPLPDALSLGILVALTCNGQPLPVKHGGPVRLVVPSRYFYKSLKWLATIELLREDRLGFWEATAGYHNAADPWTEQRFVAPKLNRDVTTQALAARDFAGKSFPGIDVDGYDLSGLQARGAVLRNAVFRRCLLQHACFEAAQLANAHFQEADLRDASFRGADVEGANFHRADLRGADLQVLSLLGVSFVDPSSDDTSTAAGAAFDRHTRIPTRLIDDLTPVQAAYVRRSLP